MKRFLAKGFRFSPFITICSVVVSGLMFIASHWQWTRYLEKVKMLETYALHDVDESHQLESLDNESLEELLYQRVSLGGTFDLSRQMIITNRRHQSGPGHWLITPFQIENRDEAILVSRGFIPFADRNPKDWKKYSPETNTARIHGVIQPTEPRRSFLHPANPEVGPGKEFATRWLYPDIEMMSRQLPYPVVKSVYLQQLDGAVLEGFPTESISVRVPPSTHFGYTIEWAILGVMTLIIGFLLQAFSDRLNRSKTLASLCILSFLTYPTLVSAVDDPSTVPEIADVNEQLGSYIPLDLRFANTDGSEIEIGQLLNSRPTIIAPVYYQCPRLCTLTLNGLLKAVNSIDLAIGHDYNIVAVSFDPDETAVLAQDKAHAYLAELKGDTHLSQHWHFLTGKEEQIQALLGTLGYGFKRAGSEFIHPSVIIVLAPDGKISRYFYGIDFPARDLRFSLIEAAEGRIGSTIDKILLYCFRFDPSEGKYSLVIMNTVRLLSLFVLAVLGLGLVGLRIQEKRGSKDA